MIPAAQERRLMSTESKALLSSLTDQREHVLGIIEGLTDEALRRPVLPSGWTCLGLVRHLAIDVERFWFRSIFAGQQVEPRASDAAVWQVGPDEPADAIVGLYRGRLSSRMPSSPAPIRTRSQPGGSVSGVTGGCTTCGRSCCT